MEGGSTTKREWHTVVGTCRGGRGAEMEAAEDDGGSSECPQRRSRRRGGVRSVRSPTGDERRGKCSWCSQPSRRGWSVEHGGGALVCKE